MVEKKISINKREDGERERERAYKATRRHVVAQDELATEEIINKRTNNEKRNSLNRRCFTQQLERSNRIFLLQGTY